MIQLKSFNRKELKDFVLSGDFQKYGFLPITRHRAISQIKNSKATDEQSLLILAFYNEELVGYVGCFPDYFIIDGKKIRYAWLSTLYVNPEFRRKRPAKKLLKKAFEEYRGNIAITEFMREAEALYNILGVFDYVFPKEGKRYYFRPDMAGIIPEKKPQIKALKPLFHILDTIAGSLLSIKNGWIKKPAFRYDILDHIDAESADFINQFSGNRNAEEINTFIESPWVLEGKEDKRYFFSSYTEVFKYFWVKIYDENNKLTSCLLLQLRNGYLKIPYLFSNTDLDRVVCFLNYFIIKNRVKAFTSYQNGLNEAIRTSGIFSTIYERDFKREYLFHKNLLQNLPEDFNPQYQDGDGDCMMT